jgi:hypothetical protein
MLVEDLILKGRLPKYQDRDKASHEPQLIILETRDGLVLVRGSSRVLESSVSWEQQHRDKKARASVNHDKHNNIPEKMREGFPIDNVLKDRRLFHKI